MISNIEKNQKVYKISLSEINYSANGMAPATLDILEFDGEHFYRGIKRIRIGMKRIQKEYHCNEEAAKLSFYRNQIKQIQRIKQKLTRKMSNVQNNIDDLNNTFGYLKEQFPEEFI